MDDLRLWKTQNFYSACLVRASGIPIHHFEKRDGKFITFHFKANPKHCDSIIKSHWDRTLMLPTRQLIETINELKTIIHEEMRRGDG